MIVSYTWAKTTNILKKKMFYALMELLMILHLYIVNLNILKSLYFCFLLFGAVFSHSLCLLCHRRHVLLLMYIVLSVTMTQLINILLVHITLWFAFPSLSFSHPHHFRLLVRCKQLVSTGLVLRPICSMKWLNLLLDHASCNHYTPLDLLLFKYSGRKLVAV